MPHVARSFASLAAAVVLLLPVWSAGAQGAKAPTPACALLSVAGFVLGASIRGSSTLIPAHYHASIGAVTIGYMAITYRLLARHGYGVLAFDLFGNGESTGHSNGLGDNAQPAVDAALDYVALWNSAFLHSEDLTEAMTAFMQRRPPQFRGQ